MPFKTIDGYLIKPRVWIYLLNWLEEKKQQHNDADFAILGSKTRLADLTQSEFWHLFHRAANDELQDKF
jgi:hypothetical protein